MIIKLLYEINYFLNDKYLSNDSLNLTLEVY